MENIGATYSNSHYEEYNRSGDNNYFEEIIDRLISDESHIPLELKNKILNIMPKDKKRIAILSFLDKDRNLFTGLKSILNEGIGKMKHIEDVILMLRKYVKVGEVEKKKFGEVMTPLELVRDMLKNLPNEVWSNPNLKWLDPANGTGPYPCYVIYKLMNGLKNWEPNEEKRYKHIVENMIYVVEIQPKNMFLYMCAVDTEDRYKLNIYTGSFLDYGFDKHMKEVWGIEKFDIVIGNPPYQELKEGNKKSQSLWDKFVENTFRYLNYGGYICYIHPSGWRDIDGLFKKTQKLMIDKEIIYLSIHSEKDGIKVFGMDTRYDYYVLKNKKNLGDFISKIRCQDGSIIESKLYNMEFIPNGMFSDIMSLVAKENDEKTEVISDSSYHTQREFMSKLESDINKHKCVYTVKNGDIPTIWYSDRNTNGHFGIPKLIWSNGRIISVGSIIDINGEYGLTQFSYAIVDNPKNLYNIKRAFDSKKFRDMMENCSVANMSINRKIISTFKKDFWKEFME